MTTPQASKSVQASQMRVAMVVCGFPHATQPFRCIFNLRAVQDLRPWAEVRVLFLRAWRPGRPAMSVGEYEGVPVITLAALQIPGEHPINAVLYRRLGWLKVRTFLHDCDIIHSVDAAGTGVVASAWARQMRKPHISQVIGSDINSILQRTHRSHLIVGWEQHVQGVACNSQALAQAFQALYPGVRNVCVIYRGVDLSRFHPEGSSDGPLANHSPVRFLFVGGFQPYPALPHRSNTKGAQTLMAAWQEAETALHAAGASLLLAGPLADSLPVVRWRANLRYPERVHLMGAIPPEKMPAYLRSADAILLPSMEEGLPNVGMEASACARPVFGSDVGGIPEVILNGQTGLILRAGDATTWAQALMEYASRFSRLAEMGSAARHYMEAHFDRREFAPKMVELYRTALCEPMDCGN